MNTIQQKINLAREKSIEWIEYLATKSEKNLEKRLRVNHAQYAIAEKNKDELSGELLNIMERIIIEARIYKEDNNIPDSISDIEETISKFENIIIKEDQSPEIQSDIDSPVKQSRSKVKSQDDNDSQLSLF